MTIPVYIVDEEIQAIERLEYLFHTFMKEDIEVVGKAIKPIEALDEIWELKPQIVFADIEMPGMTGLELAKTVNASGFEGKIVFVTAYNQYSVKAIRANAFDYLIKPIDIDELRNCIERFKKKVLERFNGDIIGHYKLSEREYDIIKLLAEGMSSSEIGDKLFLSHHTVETHRRNILAKTGVKNTVELINLLRNSN